MIMNSSDRFVNTAMFRNKSIPKRRTKGNTIKFAGFATSESKNGFFSISSLASLGFVSFFAQTTVGVFDFSFEGRGHSSGKSLSPVHLPMVFGCGEINDPVTKSMEL